MLRDSRTPVIAGVLFLLLVLGGCATPQVSALRAHPPQTLAQHTELTAVPFFPQQEFQCGPAALASVLVHNKITVTPAALVPQVYLPGREGSLQTEMLAATRRHGLVAYRLAPRFEDLLTEVAAGNPVLVLQNLTFSFAPVWHYAVVVGYDRGAEEVVLRSGVTQRLTMSFSTFERTWARGEHWAMVALPPQRLPATAGETEYVTAAAALERVSAGGAIQAYATALDRWPENLAARIGIGNAAYTRKDLPNAERAYRQATIDHPQAGDAWNNLAQVLLELDRRPEALIAAQRAVALGGSRSGQYLATLKAISDSP